MRLIDADALKPHLLNEHYHFRSVFDADEVKNAPTIDAVPVRRGAWETDREIAGKPIWSCSECTFQTLEKTPYCPMCGAKME